MKSITQKEIKFGGSTVNVVRQERVSFSDLGSSIDFSKVFKDINQNPEGNIHVKNPNLKPHPIHPEILQQKPLKNGIMQNPVVRRMGSMNSMGSIPGGDGSTRRQKAGQIESQYNSTRYNPNHSTPSRSPERPRVNSGDVGDLIEDG